MGLFSFRRPSAGTAGGVDDQCAAVLRQREWQQPDHRSVVSDHGQRENALLDE
jgi:hypothetical protein